MVEQKHIDAAKIILGFGLSYVDGPDGGVKITGDRDAFILVEDFTQAEAFAQGLEWGKYIAEQEQLKLLTDLDTVPQHTSPTTHLAEDIPHLNQVVLSGQVQEVRSYKFQTVLEVRSVRFPPGGGSEVCEIAVVATKEVMERVGSEVKAGQIISTTGPLVSIPRAEGRRRHSILASHISICHLRVSPCGWTAQHPDRAGQQGRD